MNIYKPAVEMDLPVHHVERLATVYRWDRSAKIDPKFLVVQYDGRETWCSPEWWAIQCAQKVKRPKYVQLDILFNT